MSDPFDPEAWPRSSGASSPRDDDDEANGFDPAAEDDGFNPFATEGEDDYDAAIFGTPVSQDDPANPYGTYEDEQDSFQGSYGDEDEDEDDPWNNNATGAYGDEEDDDDFAFQDAAVGAGVGAGAAAAAAGKGRGNNDFDDEFEDYDDFDDYEDNYQDDFDDDDEFNSDREPSEGGGLRKVLAVIGVLVVAGLAGGGLLYAFGDKDKDPIATGTTTTQAPAENTTTTASQQTTGTTQQPGATTQAQAPKDVMDTLDNALTAWGRFSISGNLEEVKPYFIEDSTQYNRLKLDAASIASQPPGGAPMTVVMTNPQTFNNKDNPNEWMIRGTTSWTRPGIQDQNFNYEIRMVRDSDRQPWLIQSVRQF